MTHFLLIGAILFAVSLSRDEEAGPGQIVISAADIERLKRSAAALNAREFSREEIRAALEPTIRDEVFYREALALGLDEDDDEVRRRLVEKMQYLTEDLADPEPASEAALREFFDANPEIFTIPAAVTFDQIFFSPSQRGDTIDESVAAALAALREGAQPDDYGDRTPLRNRYEDAPREQVAILFGESMTEALFSMSGLEWQGPFESDFGLHIVRLIDRNDARQPSFDEVRDTAAETFAEYRRRERNEAAYREMRERYEVVIEWPDAETSE